MYYKHKYVSFFKQRLTHPAVEMHLKRNKTHSFAHALGGIFFIKLFKRQNVGMACSSVRSWLSRQPKTGAQDEDEEVEHEMYVLGIILFSSMHNNRL